MANSNLPGYMELKVESFDGGAGTGELNLSYNEIKKYFLIGDGQVFLRVPNDFPMVPGMRIAVVAVESNVVTIGDSENSIYMTGGNSKAFSITEPTP